MPRLPVLSGKEVRAVLIRNGLEFRRRARHGDMYMHPEDPSRRAEVPDHDTVDPGTLMAIIKRAKKTVDEFRR
jgi:predicted RNA binding protein YcfA (HicA-like mRNA interferase family)